jgi:hypothetical protein
MTGKVFSFVSLRNNKLSFWQNIYTQRFRNDCFQMMSICTRILDILEVIGCWTWNWQYFLWNSKFDDRKHQIHPPTSISVCNAQSFADYQSKSHNLKASPFRTIGVLKGTIIEKWTWLTAVKKNEWTCWTRSTGLLNRGVGT